MTSTSGLSTTSIRGYGKSIDTDISISNDAVLSALRLDNSNSNNVDSDNAFANLP